MIDFGTDAPFLRSVDEYSLIPPRVVPTCAALGCQFRIVNLPDVVVFEHHAPDGQMSGYSILHDELADYTINIWSPIERRIRQAHGEEPA